MSEKSSAHLRSTDMEGRARKENGSMEDWQANAVETLARSMERTNDPAYALQRAWPSVRRTTLRAVTPENRVLGGSVANSPTSISHTSPRSIPGGEKSQERRKGLVFDDSYSSESVESKPHHLHGPPVSFHTSSRPRTRTLEETNTRNRSTSNSNSFSKTSRPRIGSVHSTSASVFHDVEPRSFVEEPASSPNYPPLSGRSQQDPVTKSGSVKAKKLSKRTSRPLSPLQAMLDVPCVDSFPSPVTTVDANKILVLMKTLCGRMRGDVEFQSVESGSWYSGTCVIDEIKGMLMHEGEDRGPFQIPVISDLRGCRVRPATLPDRRVRCLELTNRPQGVAILLVPLVKAEYDLWLAALLCWQQILPDLSVDSPTSPADKRASATNRNSVFSQIRSANGAREPNIIKVAKLQIWDKGQQPSPGAVVGYKSTKDPRSSVKSCWRRISCILQDNGELKLLTENDVTLLTTIQLSQLSRCAIQRLDRSVLDEDNCIVILPQVCNRLLKSIDSIAVLGW